MLKDFAEGFLRCYAPGRCHTYARAYRRRNVMRQYTEGGQRRPSRSEQNVARYERTMAKILAFGYGA